MKIKNLKLKKMKKSETKDIFENLSKIDEKISNIVVFTRQGYVIEKILSINPALNIIIFTDNQKVYNLSYLRSNSKILKQKNFLKF